jgi:putative transposase
MGINLGYDAPSTDLIAMALRHAVLPKHYGSEYQLQNEWGTYGKPGHFFTDGGSDFCADHVKQIAAQIDFSCHLRDRPSEGGIVERPFKTFNTELFSTLPGYVAENVQKRPEDAEKEACLTLRELERIVVRYIVDNYNQRIDARTGDQTRFQRWEAGLIASLDIMSERELDICLMKQTMRKVQRGGHLQFENLMYRGEELGGYAGENVILRFDPRDITTVLVYQQKGHREDFITRAYAMDLETECISLYEAKANSKRLRDAGKDINNRSILAEIRDRHIFSDEKTKKVRRKEEPSLVISAPTKVTSISTNEMRLEDEKEQEELPSSTSETHEVRVFDYEELQEDYGF